MMQASIMANARAGARAPAPATATSFAPQRLRLGVTLPAALTAPRRLRSIAAPMSRALPR